jgi:hypothetical protein
VVVSAELARRYGDQGLVSTSLNPGEGSSYFLRTLCVIYNTGNLKTEIARHWTSPGQKLMKLLVSRRRNFSTVTTSSYFQGHLIVYPARMGALTQLYAGTTEEGAQLNGKVCRVGRSPRYSDTLQYLVPWARIGAPNPISQEEEVGKKLCTWLEEQILPIL